MKVKISTKEKFHTLEVIDEDLSANMTDELTEKFENILDDEIKNVVLDLRHVKTIDDNISSLLTGITERFKNKNASFVICEIQPEVKDVFKKNKALDSLNTTPTESEAWDIIQMDEIERELLGNEE